MKKIISILLCAVLLLFATVIPAAADDGYGSIAALYFKDHTLTAFLETDDPDTLANTVAYLQLDDSIVPTSVPVKPITEYDSPVSYLLVIDVSDSMEEYKDKILDLVRGMLESEKMSYDVTVAAMGERFRILKTDLTDLNQVLSVINGIRFEDTLSEICEGAIRAIEHLSDITPREGELQNIVLITDGDTYLSNYGRDDENMIREDAEGARKVISDSPEYLIHTVCTDRWNQQTFNAVSITPGVDLQIPYFGDGRAYGRTISSYVDKLFRADIPYNLQSYESRFDAQLIIGSTLTGISQTLPATGIRNYDVKQYRYFPHYENGELVGVDYIPEAPTESEEPTDPISPVPAPVTPTSPDGSVLPSEISPSASESPSTVSATADEAGSEEEFKILGLAWWIVALILGGILLVVILILILAVKSSRRKKNAALRAPAKARAPMSVHVPSSVDPSFVPTPDVYPATTPSSGNCIVMKPELLYGSAHCSSAELQLYDQLIIGTASDCDIVVEDTVASPHNTRVFIEGGVIYIEDLNENSCTYLGGMKIFSKNRLRSGEEIIVGDTSFKLRF